VDIDALLRSLNARKARYLIIGATAFPVYGYARATLDLDLFIEATEEERLPRPGGSDRLRL
jgi:hypothetical protein